MGSQPGSAVILFEVTATLVSGTCCNLLASIQGHLVLSDGTGGLAGLHGEGTIGLESGHMTYSVFVHFDPA